MSSLSAVAATRAISGYRRLFRARSRLFAGDAPALRESAIAIRSEFEKNRSAPPEKVDLLLGMIDDAEDMLLHGVVRGALNRERNVVEVKIGPEHGARMDTGTMTHIDPITKETGPRLAEGVAIARTVEVTKSGDTTM